MKEFITSLDWNATITTVWTVIILPVLTKIGLEINKWAKARKVDKYTDILKRNVIDAVKGTYESVVKDIKGSDDWTDEKKEEVREIAKRKAIYALQNSAYECLKKANGDFDEMLDGMIDVALYEVKNTF